MTLRHEKCVLAALVALLGGCPATLNTVLKNGTDSEIVVLYDSGFESTIKPGDSRKENYQVQCIRLRHDGQIFEFSPIPLSEDYIRSGTSGSTVRAEFTANGEFQVYARDGEELRLKEGCD